MTGEGQTGDLLDRLWNIEQIKQLKARYFRFIDNRNWDALTDVFTADCVFVADGVKSESSVAEFIATAQALVTPGVSVHHGHMPEISITGPSTASAIWSMFDYVEISPFDKAASFRGYGHYLETYQKSPEKGWQISRWELTRLWMQHF